MPKTRQPRNFTPAGHVVTEHLRNRPARCARKVATSPSTRAKDWVAILRSHPLVPRAALPPSVRELIAASITSGWWVRHSNLPSCYASVLRLLDHAFGSIPVEAVTYADARIFCKMIGVPAEAFKGRPLPAAAELAVRIARSLWNFGRQAGLCTRNPFYGVRLKRRVGAPVTRRRDQRTTFIPASDVTRRPQIAVVLAIASHKRSQCTSVYIRLVRRR